MKMNYEDFKGKLLQNPYYAKEYDTPRKLENALKKRYTEYSDLYKKPLVKEIFVNIEYSTRGVARGTARIVYVNNTGAYDDKFKASGWGYDKSNSILEQVLNKYAIQNLLDYTQNEAYAGDKESRLGYDNQKHAGIYYGDYQPYYSFGSDSGRYFNFEIEKIAGGNDFNSYHIRFFNAATNKMYAHKTKTPRKTAKKPCVGVNFRAML